MWLKLDSSLVRTHLAANEIDALSRAELPFDVDKILQEECDHWASAWRGRLRKFFHIDGRAGFVPSEYLVFILAHVRYSSFTRLPNMSILLDELRQKEKERADEIFDDPTIEPEEPEEEEGGDPFASPHIIVQCRARRWDRCH